MYMIPVLDDVINTHIEGYRVAQFTPSQIQTIYENLVLSGMGFIKSAKDFKNRLSFLSKEECMALRRNLYTNPQIVLGLRGFIFNLLQDEVPFTNTEAIFKRYKSYMEGPFKLAKFDILENVQILGICENVLKPYVEEIKSYPKIVVPAKMQQLCQEQLNKLETTIKHYVYRKLRFICASNNLDVEDLAGSIREDLITSCFFELAYKRGDKLRNTLSSGIKQSGINLLYYYNAEKRQVLKRTEEEGSALNYHSLVSSLSVGNSDGEELDMLGIYDDKENAQKIEQINFNNSFYFQAERMMQELKDEATSKYLEPFTLQNWDSKKEFTLILSNKNQKFVNWYNKRKKNFKAINVSDIAEEEGPKILNLIKSYLKVEDDIFSKMLSSFKGKYNELLKEGE